METKRRTRRSRADDLSGPSPQIMMMAIDQIAPDPKNPRIHDRQQLRAIARSIETFGFNAPILVRSDNQIVAGHGRLEAAKLLQMTEVPVIRLDHLTGAGAEAKAVAVTAKQALIQIAAESPLNRRRVMQLLDRKSFDG